MSPEPEFIAQAYGLTWASAFPLDQFEAVTGTAAPDVRVCRIAALPERAPLAQVRAGAVFADGTRFPWHRQALFDMVDGRRIDVLPGPAWSGSLPHAFYGTVAAHLLAWRGLIPMHGCTVAIDGRAVLILGEAGAGKSSLTAGLIAAGATLVSDDLSALAFDPATGAQPTVLPGRTTIRLDPTVAAWTAGERLALPPRETRGKLVVRPAVRSDGGPVPLAAIIQLGSGADAGSPLARAGLLSRHLFRPVWMAALPGHPARQHALLALAARVAVIGFPAVAGGGASVHADRAALLLERVRAL